MKKALAILIASVFVAGSALAQAPASGTLPEGAGGAGGQGASAAVSAARDGNAGMVAGAVAAVAVLCIIFCKDENTTGSTSGT